MLLEVCFVAHMDLDRNPIGVKGARRLAEVLPPCPSLARLDLGSNSIGATASLRGESARK